MKFIKILIGLCFVLGFYANAYSQPPSTPLVDIRKYDQIPEDYTGSWYYLCGIAYTTDCYLLPATDVHYLRTGNNFQVQMIFQLKGCGYPELEALIPDPGPLENADPGATEKGFRKDLFIKITLANYHDSNLYQSPKNLYAVINASGFLMVQFPAFELEY